MAIFDSVMSVLGYVNMLAWIVAAGAAFKFRNFFKGNSTAWTYILIGSLFVLTRQVIKLTPVYDSAGGYISRYVFGGIGAILLFIGFLHLYMVARK